jgi:hypothetical protein
VLAADLRRPAFLLHQDRDDLFLAFIMSCRRTLVPHEGQIGAQVTAHVAFGSYDRLGLCDFLVFMAHPIGLLCTLHARAVARATLATEGITRSGFSPA